MFKISLETNLDKKLSIETPFMALPILSLIWGAKESFSSRTKPRCLSDDSLPTGILLKVRTGWKGLFNL